MEELLSLKWNNHCSTFLQVLSNIRSKEQYSDVTLICENKYYNVHRMVLSTCSDYFKGMFDKLGHHQTLAVVLNDIKAEHFDLLLDYMYLGEVNVKQSDLTALIKTSEFLQIKGLAVADEVPKRSQDQSNLKRKLDSPYAKKKKKSKRNDTPYEDIPLRESFKKTDAALSHSFQESNEPTYDENDIKDDISSIVKEEPKEIFVEEIFPSQDFKHQMSSSDLTQEGDKESQLEYLSESQTMQDSIDIDDSNYSSSSIQGQPTSWEESDLSLNLGTQDVPSTADTSSGPRLRFICQWCRKEFGCKSKLATHVRIHTGEKPFSCILCNYRATQKASLQYHMICKHA